MFLVKIIAVVTPDMIEILSILLKETDKIFILTDRLSGQIAVVLAQEETLNIIVTIANTEVFTVILLAQHQKP